MNKSKKIIIAVLLITILIIGLIVVSEKRRSDNVKSEIAYENTLVDMVKSSLNLYRVVHGSYPQSTEVLLRDLEEDVKTGRVEKEISGVIDTTKKSIKNLKDFDFSVRGDEEAYQITYTDFEGNKKAVEGNYNKEFQ